MSVTVHKLGEFIERIERTNADGKYGVEDVRGVSNTKLIQKTKASMDGRDFTPFTVLNPREFIFNRRTTRNGERLGLGFNQDDRPYIFTEDYVAFRVKDESVLLPEYLYIMFLRDEFDRYVRWDSWGSATEFFNWENMQRVEIPVPTIEEQRTVVAVWQGLRKMKEENEQLAEPLMQLCRSYLEECKKKWPMTELGPMIERLNARNSDNKISAVRGMSTEKEFRVPQARVDFDNLSNYKIVHRDDFVFVQTTDTWRCLAICLSRESEPFVVSPIYEVFRFKANSRVLPEYFHLWCKRHEFDRYARFNSWGSARENFTWSDMCRVKIPLPPLEVQQAIVDVYRCASEAKKIAAEAEELSRAVCPALVRGAGETAPTERAGARQGTGPTERGNTPEEV